MSFFAQKTNQVITRDELSKEVWENKGVVVSRSLDIFISRLRKKLVLDNKVTIKNFHGKGYIEVYGYTTIGFNLNTGISFKLE